LAAAGILPRGLGADDLLVIDDKEADMSGGAIDTSLRAPRDVPERGESTRGAGPAVLAFVGLAVVAVAASALFLELHGRGERRAVLASSTAPAVAPDVGTTDGTYEPGHSSGWHIHPGVHSVVVLSGTLTVYDEECGRREYGPGETYLGGDRPHLARNETPDVVHFAVTYVFDHASPIAPGKVVPAPAACDPTVV
jgi:quercetin dioxygenase-like cupin family protein